MPRLVNKLPKYSLHKPSGQAKVRYGGKDTYLGQYGSPESKEAYARFIASTAQAGGCAELASRRPACPVVGECVEHFEEHARSTTARDGVPTGEHTTIRTPSPLTTGSRPAGDSSSGRRSSSRSGRT